MVCRWAGARAVSVGWVACALALAACGAVTDPPAGDGLDGADVEVEDGGADAYEDALEDAFTPPPDRLAGERAPLTRRCDDVEPGWCLLPWPSSAFLRADGATATGVRLAVPLDVLPEDEPVALLNDADGFSRVTPLLAILPGDVDPASLEGALRVFEAEPGARFGREVPLRHMLFPSPVPHRPALLVAYPRRPMAPATEHLAVLSGVSRVGGELMAASPDALIALGLVEPSTAEEHALRAYHAPARALLAEVDVPATAVVRAWDFTTRSEDDPLGPLRALAAAAVGAVDAGEVEVVVELVETPSRPEMALVVWGRVAGLPDGDATYDAPFRVVIPAGEGDYRIVLYCHGAGGDVGDRSFDPLIAEYGAAKVGMEVDGWTEDTLPDTIVDLLVPIAGTRAVTERMARAIAGMRAIHRALGGALGAALGADTLAGAPNPEAGRFPNLELPVWAGGSLGGVVGLVYSHVEPSVAGGVLNVPGAGFSHWISHSALYQVLLLGLELRYPEEIDVQLVMAMTQGLWDEVDGATWAGTRAEPPVFVVQISVGDPVMPNLASELVATSLDAVHLGVPTSEIPGLERADEARGRSGVTQFIAPGTSPSAVHGFTARDTPAGRAAQAQFIGLIDSLWAGDPVIRVPEACLALDPPGLCDFSE